MPFYDFQCEDCGNDFELERPISRRDEADCPRCRSRKVKRLVRSVNAITTGGGGGGGGCAPSSGGSGGG